MQRMDRVRQAAHRMIECHRHDFDGLRLERGVREIPHQSSQRKGPSPADDADCTKSNIDTMCCSCSDASLEPIGTCAGLRSFFAMAVADRLKTALDESRLLILGVQVLFGFQFEAVFQELFATIPASSRYVHCTGLVLLLVSLGFLIAPSLFHQIVYHGNSTPQAVRMATTFAGASLLPLTLGLG